MRALGVAAVVLTASCSSAFPMCAPFAARLRGGCAIRPWREMPLDDGEVAYFHTKRGGEALKMTATDWKAVDPVPADREYPDPRIFTEGLAATDDAVAKALRSEMTRQQVRDHLTACRESSI